MRGSEFLGFISYRFIVELDDDDESEKKIAQISRRKIYTIIMFCIFICLYTRKYVNIARILLNDDALLL